MKQWGQENREPGRTVITAGNEKELNQRIKDLEDRGWTVKQIVEVGEKHYQDYSYGDRNKRIFRSDPAAKKYKAVMVKDMQDVSK